MARTKAPLFGLDASGTLGGAITFSRWKGRTYCRVHAVPANPRSPLQLGMRAVFRYITQAWRALSAVQQAEWDDLATPDNITNLNAQVRDAQRRARVNAGWRIGPDEAAGVTPDQPTALAAAAQNQGAVLTWTRPVGNQGDYTTAIYVGLTGSDFPDISTLRAVIDVTLETVTITGLTNGTQYSCTVAETNIDGELGAIAAGVNFTPAA